MAASSLASTIGTYGYIVTFTSGLVGHSCSLLTFSQREIRSTSTAGLFLTITAFDMLYLLMSLHDFLLINLGVPQLSPYYVQLCRFRTFILNFCQTISPWILVLVGFDRYIRAYLPHQTKRLCSKKNMAIVISVAIACAVALNSHVLQTGFSVGSSIRLAICGPPRQNMTEYGIFYYYTWPGLQIWVNILIPALLMIAFVIAVHRKMQNAALVRRNPRLQSQMVILMLSKIVLFLVCTLPYATYRMLVLYSTAQQESGQTSSYAIGFAILTIFLNANFSLTFYVHCLTSTLFRKTFFATITKCCRRQPVTVLPVTYIPTTVG